jgi:hypothetical protein
VAVPDAATVVDSEVAFAAGAVGFVTVADGFAPVTAGFATSAAGFTESVDGFAATDLAAGVAFFAAPIPAKPLKSGAAGASKLIPCGNAGSVSTATFNPENFGAAVGPGTLTRSFGFRMKKNNPPAMARHTPTPTMINTVLDPLSSAGAAVGFAGLAAAAVSATSEGSSSGVSVAIFLSSGVGACPRSA